MFSYPVYLEGSYSNDTQYRNFMRHLFSMNHNCPWDSTTVHEIDELSLDEWDYDEFSTTELLDTIYDGTHLIPEFKKLYQLAAATMMSQDNTIGLAVLFSYSFAQLFHKCIIVYLTYNGSNLSELPDFIELRRLLTKK